MKSSLTSEELRITARTLNKGLKQLKLILEDRKKHKFTVKLIKKVLNDNDLYQLAESNAKKVKGGKITLFQVIQTLNFIKKEIKKENRNNLHSNFDSELRGPKESITVDLKDGYEIIYFTWHDVRFTKKGLKIDPNIVYLSIEIEGPTKILNELKETYFIDNFSEDLFKVYVSKKSKRVNYNKSKDILKIKNIVSNHIISIENERGEKSRILGKPEFKSITNYKETTNVKVKDIKKKFHNNMFIQVASKFLNYKGEAIALWENNNSVMEEALLIIQNYRNDTYVIWENINDNRACYIFKYKNNNIELKIKKLIQFVNSNIKYKRMDLYNNKVVKKLLKYEEYYTIIHDTIESYRTRLNYHLKQKSNFN